jgi:hypothetical protein
MSDDEKYRPNGIFARGGRSMRSNTARLIPTVLVLVVMGIFATGSAAGQSPGMSCAKKLQGFVESVDELLSKNVLAKEPYKVAMGQYLPATGCTVEEVLSISKTSRFFSPPYEDYASYTIVFKNADVVVAFGLRKDIGNKDTGNIDYPVVHSTHAPSW